MIIKGVEKARVTACKRAVCTAPVDGQAKKPKAAPLLETPHAMPKEHIRGSVPAVPAREVPAAVGTAVYHKPVKKTAHTIAGKRAVVTASCTEIEPGYLQFIRMASPENVTIDGLFL